MGEGVRGAPQELKHGRMGRQGELQAWKEAKNEMPKLERRGEHTLTSLSSTFQSLAKTSQQLTFIRKPSGKRAWRDTGA